MDLPKSRLGHVQGQGFRKHLKVGDTKFQEHSFIEVKVLEGHSPKQKGTFSCRYNI